MDSSSQQMDTRDRILAEAERLFRHYGYSKTTIADISDACEMSSANIYRFFPSKSALIEAICSRVISDLEKRLFAILRKPAPASERLTLLIQEIHNHTLENLLDHRKVHEMVLVALNEQWATIRAHVDRITSYIAELIEQGIAAGEFPEKDVQRTAKAFHTAMVCFCHPAMVAQKLEDEQRVSPEEMAAFLIKSLKSG
jgi:AcrR family transcriptional regulator